MDSQPNNPPATSEVPSPKADDETVTQKLQTGERKLQTGMQSQASASALNTVRATSMMKPGDTTTIDLMYSYENQNKVVFSEDTIRRMTQKLKAVR
jgi:hypothetical protein